MLAVGAISALGQSCETDRQEFSQISAQLLVGWNTEKENKSKVVAKRIQLTNTAVELIRSGVLKLLNQYSSAIADDILSYVRCVQGLPLYQGEPIYEGWESFIDAPKVYFLNTVDPNGMMLAYFIYRGPFPAGIPDTMPFVDSFAKRARKWELVGSMGEDFQSSTFHISPISSPLPKQSWFLLSGFHIGDTGTRLMLEIVSFDGQSSRSIWKISGLQKTILEENHGTYIVLSQYRGFENGHDIYEHIRWNVTPNGMERSLAAK
jgi:hypothetical protein